MENWFTRPRYPSGSIRHIASEDSLSDYRAKMVLISVTIKTSLATWYPIQSHSIAWLDVHHLRPDSYDFAGTLMPEYAWKASGVLPGHHVLVTVTDSRCAHFDQNFTIEGISEIEGLYLDWSTDVIKGYSGYLHVVPPKPHSVENRRAKREGGDFANVAVSLMRDWEHEGRLSGTGSYRPGTREFASRP